MNLWRQRLKPALPWLSLAVGTASAFLMNRSPGRAWIVVVASLLVWMFLLGLARVDAAHAVAVPTRHRAHVGRYALLFFSQVLTQQALMFPLPFYLRAATLHPRHAAFFVAYAIAIAVALWDPLYDRVARRPTLALALSSFAVFVGLAMVLPVLSLSNALSLVLAGLGASLALPLASLLSAVRPSRRRVLATVAGIGLLVVLARGLAFLIPPAPLELVAIDIGTDVVDRALVGNKPGDDDVLVAPAALFCHTAIKAPLGLRDALVHVWRRDGVLLSSVPLDVRGGRDAGFRTWSRHTAADGVRPGRYACDVQTSSGQVLGRTRVRVR